MMRPLFEQIVNRIKAKISARIPIRNKNTRIAYYHAIGEFLAWTEAHSFLVAMVVIPDNAKIWE